jgi:hypothetical protein
MDSDVEYDSDGEVNFYSSFPPVVQQPKLAPPIFDDDGEPYPSFDECYQLQEQQGAHAGHGGNNDGGETDANGMVRITCFFILARFFQFHFFFFFIAIVAASYCMRLSCCLVIHALSFCLLSPDTCTRENTSDLPFFPTLLSSSTIIGHTSPFVHHVRP